MLAHYGLVLLCFFIDGILNILFPANFGFSSMYFVPCFGFCALMLTIRKMKFADAMIMSILFGMFYGFFYAGAMFTNVFLFVFSCLISRLWTKQVNDSAIENIVLCITTLFVKELMLYLWMHWSHQSALDFNTWLVNRMFFTLLVNGILVIALVFMSYVKDDFLRRRDVQIRREEKLPWMH